MQRQLLFYNVASYEGEGGTEKSEKEGGGGKGGQKKINFLEPTQPLCAVPQVRVAKFTIVMINRQSMQQNEFIQVYNNSEFNTMWVHH